MQRAGHPHAFPAATGGTICTKEHIRTPKVAGRQHASLSIFFVLVVFYHVINVYLFNLKGGKWPEEEDARGRDGRHSSCRGSPFVPCPCWSPRDAPQCLAGCRRTLAIRSLSQTWCLTCTHLSKVKPARHSHEVRTAAIGIIQGYSSVLLSGHPVAIQKNKVSTFSLHHIL